MGHFIQAIVAPECTAWRLRELWPELVACTHDGHYILFPLDAHLIDSRIRPEKTPRQTDEAFMFLTQGLRCFLALASTDGNLAYVETEYFGGHGGQGALVLQNGNEIMAPEWSESDTINRALKLLGVKPSNTQDEFLEVGLGVARNNEDLLERLAPWPEKRIS